MNRAKDGDEDGDADDVDGQQGQQQCQWAVSTATVVLTYLWHNVSWKLQVRLWQHLPCLGVWQPVHLGHI